MNPYENPASYPIGPTKEDTRYWELVKLLCEIKNKLINIEKTLEEKK